MPDEIAQPKSISWGQKLASNKNLICLRDPSAPRWRIYKGSTFSTMASSSNCRRRKEAKQIYIINLSYLVSSPKCWFLFEFHTSNPSRGSWSWACVYPLTVHRVPCSSKVPPRSGSRGRQGSCGKKFLWKAILRTLTTLKTLLPTGYRCVEFHWNYCQDFCTMDRSLK